MSAEASKAKIKKRNEVNIERWVLRCDHNLRGYYTVPCVWHPDELSSKGWVIGGPFRDGVASPKKNRPRGSWPEEES